MIIFSATGNEKVCTEKNFQININPIIVILNFYIKWPF